MFLFLEYNRFSIMGPGDLKIKENKRKQELHKIEYLS